MNRMRPAKILLVDDEVRNLTLLEAMLLHQPYALQRATNGLEALEKAAADPPDLVLLDVVMPGLDGFEVAARLKACESTLNSPIIMLTSLDDRESRRRGLEAGAEDFLSKPVDRIELTARVRNLLKLKELSDYLAANNCILEQRVAERTRDLCANHRETILIMTRAAEYRDDDTGAHVRRISYYCTELAMALGMDAEFRDRIFYASPMHDIGKIGIPDHILLKPGGFTPKEWAVMKTHVEIGAEILEGSGSPYLQMGAEIARCHHERWDGTGYPQGLAGERIPLAARIMQICDVYDALRSKRPYKPALEHEASLAIITEGDGRTLPGHFAPAVLDAFGRSAARFAEIWIANTD